MNSAFAATRPYGRTAIRPYGLLAVCAVTLAACKTSGKGVVALEGATLIDGSGGPPVTDAVLLIKDGHLTAAARVNEITVPRGAQVISLVGKTIIPGLIDAHAHVERWALPRYVAWGVTTVRDLGALSNDSAFALKADVNLGTAFGPRMFTSGAMIDGVPATYPNAAAVASGSEARRAVDQRAAPGASGADYIKVYTKITPALLGPLMDEATPLRMRVAAHLGKTDALTAARAGVASLEHMSGVVQAAARNPAPYFRAHDLFLAGWTLEEEGWAALDSATLARTARALAQTHVAIVPTLVVHEMLAHLADTSLRSRPEMADVPDDTANVVRQVVSLLRRTNWRAADFAAFQRSRPRQDLFVREFKRAGGLIVAGSDAANQLLVPGASLHEEMLLLTEAGLSPLEAITAATRHGAQLLEADSLGYLVPGKAADLVVLNTSPAQNINNTRDIAWVMIRGRIVRPDSLRTAWKK